MTRQCMRPDCDRRASACLTYDADTSEVWLQDPRDDDEPAQLVCSLHAGSLTAPLGWTITDRRSSEVQTAEPEPELVPDPEPEPQLENPPVAEPEPRSEPAVAATAPSGSHPDPATNPLDEPDPEPVSADPAPEPEAARPKPRKNSLLDRAFEWTGPQHSVLTTDTPTQTEEEAQQND